MKIEASNRQGDMFPIVNLTVETDKDRETLRNLLEELKIVRRNAIPANVAGDCNPIVGHSVLNCGINSVALQIVIGDIEKPFKIV